MYPIESSVFWILIRHSHAQGHKSTVAFLLFALSQYLKVVVVKLGTLSHWCVYKHAVSHPEKDQNNCDCERRDSSSPLIYIHETENKVRKKQNNESVMDWHCIRLCNCKILHASQWRNLPIFNLKWLRNVREIVQSENGGSYAFMFLYISKLFDASVLRNRRLLGCQWDPKIVQHCLIHQFVKNLL